MNWQDWLVSRSHNIYIGTLSAKELVIANCNREDLEDVIAQLVPVEYKQGYLRYLNIPEILMIDYGSASTFIFIQY